MGSSVSLLSLAVLMPAILAAQVTNDSLPLDAAVIDRVSEAVAEQWNTSADRIVFEWGTFSGNPSTILPDDSFRLLEGTSGVFVAEFVPSSGSPIAVRLRVGVYDSVPVATRTLSSGSTLGFDDIAFVEQVRWGQPQAEGELVPNVGWRVRRSIVEGGLLRRPAVEPPLLVEPGSRLTLVWQRDRVSVAIEGSAINGATLGEEVRVRLDDRRGRAVGVVTGPGLARLISRSKR